MVFYRLANDLPLTGEVLTAVGYTRECLFAGRNDYYLTKGFLKELARLNPPELKMTEENAYRVVKEELLGYRKKRRPRPIKKEVWSPAITLVRRMS